MKTSFTYETSDKKTFPKIMKLIGKETYILFNLPGKGIVIHNGSQNSYHEVGNFSDGWNMDKFEDCSGIWTIEQ